jgi:hypothetical protein
LKIKAIFLLFSEGGSAVVLRTATALLITQVLSSRGGEETYNM